MLFYLDSKKWNKLTLFLKTCFCFLSKRLIILLVKLYYAFYPSDIKLNPCYFMSHLMGTWLSELHIKWKWKRMLVIVIFQKVEQFFLRKDKTLNKKLNKEKYCSLKKSALQETPFILKSFTTMILYTYCRGKLSHINLLSLQSMLPLVRP